MKIFFPQWQGSGTGKSIKEGAKTVLDHLNDDAFITVPLSSIPSGTNGKKEYDINNYQAITEQLHRLKTVIENANPNTIQTIGGDCGLEIVPVSFLNKKYSNLGVIWFDAHADINRPCDSASCNFHGMPLRTLLGEGEEKMNSLLGATITSSQIHYVGLRDTDDSERAFITAENIYAPNQLHIPNLVKMLQHKGITQLYLHFDFDCLEPSDYDQTYYQVPDGIRIKEAEDCITALQANFTVVGSSVLESTTTDSAALAPIQNILNLLMK